MAINEVPISNTDAALRLVENLRAMQATIDGFVVPPTPLDPRARLRGHGRFPDGFFVNLAATLESSPQFAAALKAAGITMTPAEIRDMLGYCDAFGSVADELDRFARGIRYTLGLRRAQVGRTAASAYAIAKGLNLLVDVSLPVPEVESIKRSFRRRKAAAEPTTPPTTPPVAPKSP